MRNDYIMKMIEQFARVLSKVIFYKELKSYSLAQDELNDGSKMLSGFSLEQIKKLSVKDLSLVFSISTIEGRAKLFYTSKLLQEEAEVFEIEKKHEASSLSYVKSLEILEELRKHLTSNDGIKKNHLDFEIRNIREKIIN